MKRVGLMGGTFNPIHLGHLHMAQALQKKLALKEVRFIPSANPPHRDTPSTSAQDRANMVALAIQDYPGFVLDTLELERSNYSYTIDTLSSLKAQATDDVALCWLMGSDAFAAIDSWHRWQELLDYCHIVVVQRPGESTQTMNVAVRTLLNKHQVNDQALLQGQAGKILILEVDALAISSTSIRQRLLNKEDVSDAIPAAVLGYIAEHSLYETSS